MSLLAIIIIDIIILAVAVLKFLVALHGSPKDFLGITGLVSSLLP